MTGKHFVKKLVISGDYQEFLEFVRKKGFEAFEAVYCHRPEQLFGHPYERTRVIFAGAYWQNPLYDDDALRHVLEQTGDALPGAPVYA